MNTGDITADDILSTLQKTKTARSKLTMIVFGQGERAGKIYDEAMEVAQNYASLAQIVRVPDPSVLQSEFSELASAAGQGHDVVVLSLGFRIVARLRGSDALDFDALDGAFVRATEEG